MGMMFKISAATKITDGDTVHVVVDLGFRITANITVRLANINCPEIDTEEGKQARDVVQAWFTTNTALLLQSLKQDKYGRWVGIISSSTSVLNQYLRDTGHAKPI